MAQGLRGAGSSQEPSYGKSLPFILLSKLIKLWREKKKAGVLKDGAAGCKEEEDHK